MIKATYTHPKMQTKVVWAGLYGGHYDMITFFKKKPVASKEPHNHIEGEWYDIVDNKDLIIGDMYLCNFHKCFPNIDLSKYTQKNGRPLAIEIPEVFQIEITTCFDEYGDMEGFSFRNEF